MNYWIQQSFLVNNHLYRMWDFNSMPVHLILVNKNIPESCRNVVCQGHRSMIETWGLPCTELWDEDWWANLNSSVSGLEAKKAEGSGPPGKSWPHNGARVSPVNHSTPVHLRTSHKTRRLAHSSSTGVQTLLWNPALPDFQQLSNPFRRKDSLDFRFWFYKHEKQY